MKPIQSFVFDLGNVVVDVEYPRFCRQAGIDVQAFQDFYESPFFRELELGHKDREAFYLELEEKTGFPRSNRKYVDENIRLAFPLRLKTWGLIHFLKRHYPVFLLSNTNIIDFESIDRYIGIRKTFHKVYLSYEQGYSKPYPETFRHAADYLGLNPAQTLFLDDREDNIAGAEKAGWQAEQVTDELKMIRRIISVCGLNPDLFRS
jgi:FMN phosphatase YigB (HAD superfamily)